MKAITLGVALTFFAHVAFAQESATEAPVTPDDRLNAVLWQLTSAEYEGATRTAFAMARVALDKALKDKKHTAAIEQTGKFAKLPPAIIFDIDETVLDNGPNQVRMMLDTKTRPAELMARWHERGVAKPVPGAVEFIEYAQSKGVTLFFITNRNAEKEDGTRKNLEAIGVKLPATVDTVMMEHEKPEWKFDKGLRRATVAKDYRVVLVVGDDYGDFTSVWNKPTDERRKDAETEAARWGRDWILIPNPIYGSWENAAIKFNFRAPPDERRKIKHDTLKAFDAAE
ncbi:MAG: 5-nucleotide phosphatase [Rhodospirillaceae bacterium]|nr:5-nucleotide phosphatase [Rhodospirillaceae bacterium]